MTTLAKLHIKQVKGIEFISVLIIGPFLGLDVKHKVIGCKFTNALLALAFSTAYCIKIQCDGKLQVLPGKITYYLQAEISHKKL